MSECARARARVCVLCARMRARMLVCVCCARVYVCACFTVLKRRIVQNAAVKGYTHVVEYLLGQYFLRSIVLSSAA